MGVHTTNAVTHRGRRTPASSRADHIATYHLDVFGVDAADVVVAAGGWLFDRVMAGWDVRVTLTRDCDLRPLHILGAGTGPRGEQVPVPVAMAASARALCDAPARRGDLAAALRRGRAEVTLWGDVQSAGLHGGDRPMLPVQHVLSAAARVFKVHALAAAGVSGVGVDAAETFRTGNRSLLLVPPDLGPL